MSERIGVIALNLAFALYLVHYIPQLCHNRRKEKLRYVSLHFHGLLGISYLCDLSYGVGMRLPWQYCTVSIIGSICLGIQHWQLKALHQHGKTFQIYTWIFSAILIIFVAENSLPSQQIVFLGMGYLAQASALLFLLPVIVRNIKQKKANALSMGYLGLNSLCYLSNLIAALSLNWPLPSRIGTCFGLTCLCILLVQRFYYQSYQQSPLSKLNATM